MNRARGKKQTCCGPESRGYLLPTAAQRLRLRFAHLRLSPSPPPHSSRSDNFPDFLLLLESSREFSATNRGRNDDLTRRIGGGEGRFFVTRIVCKSSKTYPRFILSLSLSLSQSPRTRRNTGCVFPRRSTINYPTRLPAIASPIRKFLTIQSLDR